MRQRPNDSSLLAEVSRDDPWHQLSDDRSTTTIGCPSDLGGVFCRLCAPSKDYSRVYYRAATSSRRAHCAACGDTLRDALLIAIFGVAVGGAVVACTLYLIWGRLLSQQWRTDLHEAWQRFRPYNKVKIMFGFFFIASKVGQVYDVELPQTVLRSMDSFAAITSFGLVRVQSAIECAGSRGYVANLGVFILLVPTLAAIIALVATVYVLSSTGALMQALALRSLRPLVELRRAVVHASVPALLRMLFILYPVVTNLAFDAFSCWDLDGRRYLKVDVAIECGTAEHDRAKRLAWVAIILYAFGLLLLNAALLFWARKDLLKRRQTQFTQMIDFLHGEFKPHFFWRALSPPLPAAPPPCHPPHLPVSWQPPCAPRGARAGGNWSSSCAVSFSLGLWCLHRAQSYSSYSARCSLPSFSCSRSKPTPTRLWMTIFWRRRPPLLSSLSSSAAPHSRVPCSQALRTFNRRCRLSNDQSTSSMWPISRSS